MRKTQNDKGKRAMPTSIWQYNKRLGTTSQLIYYTHTDWTDCGHLRNSYL